MSSIIVAVLSVTVIGSICAAVLSVASKFMAVRIDERVVRISQCLPGMNCGACGFPGCSGYAMALISDNPPKSNLCTPGGAAVLSQLKEILGVDSGEFEAKRAVVHCRGDKTAHQIKADYEGIRTCVAAKELFNGEVACAFGCLGYGDCRRVCPRDAVCMEDGLARIDPRLCTGCGLCEKACPNQLIKIDAVSIGAVVLCSSLEKGAAAKKKCSNCCIACGKCVRECPAGAIVLEDNLAVIDAEKCTDCGHCATSCVMHCIKLFAAAKAV